MDTEGLPHIVLGGHHASICWRQDVIESKGVSELASLSGWSTSPSVRRHAESDRFNSPHGIECDSLVLVESLHLLERLNTILVEPVNLLVAMD